MSVKTSNWALIEDYSYSQGSGYGDRKTLPAESYVKPVEWKYLPRHITEDGENRWHNTETHVFCHTKHGMIPVPRRILKEK